MKEIQLQQGSSEWLEYRKNGIGASEVASIAGIEGAFKTRQQILEEKLGAVAPVSAHLQKLFAEGHEWERVVRENMNAAGWKFEPAVCVADWNDRLFASLDGLDRERQIILEVKSVSTEDRFFQYAEKVPAHYYVQCQWQMLITGLKGVHLVFVYDGNVKTTIITPDANDQKYLQNAADTFLKELDAIKAGDLPSPIKALASPDMTRLAFLKAQEKEMQIQIDMVTEEIKYLAEKVLKENDARKVESESVTVEWVEREGSVDYKKIPELEKIDLNQYRKKGTKYIKVSVKK